MNPYQNFSFIFLLAVLSGGLASAPADDLQVNRITFHAPSVNREMNFNILLPKSYEGSDQRYPTLYLLHGRKGDENYWVELGVPDEADSYEMIVVMVSAKPSWYVNWQVSDNDEKNDWGDYVAKDLIQYVDSHYRTVASREGRAICGKSMGGYGALTLAFKNPSLFCSTGSIAGGLRFIDKLRTYLNGEGKDPLFLQGEVHKSKRELAAATPRGRMVTSPADCDAIDPYQLVLQVPRDRMPDIRIDCGLDDSLLEASQQLALLLMKEGIPFTFCQSPGAHTAEYGAEAIKGVMAHQYRVMTQQ